MKRFYICEDGNDNGIETFDSAFEAINYAKENERVKEVFEYVENAGEIEVVGLIFRSETEQ